MRERQNPPHHKPPWPGRQGQADGIHSFLRSHSLARYLIIGRLTSRRKLMMSTSQPTFIVRIAEISSFNALVVVPSPMTEQYSTHQRHNAFFVKTRHIAICISAPHNDY
jgi:hypothetical protein